jgi:anti-sigma factor RsiW
MSGHLAWATLVDYWSGDLDAHTQHELELHLMGCDACSALSARVATLTESLRKLYPPLLTAARLAELVERGVAIAENTMAPEQRREVEFPADAAILLHRLGGLALADAERVTFVLRSERAGEELVRFENAP